MIQSVRGWKYHAKSIASSFDAKFDMLQCAHNGHSMHKIQTSSNRRSVAELNDLLLSYQTRLHSASGVEHQPLPDWQSSNVTLANSPAQT